LTDFCVIEICIYNSEPDYGTIRPFLFIFSQQDRIYRTTLLESYRGPSLGALH